MTWPAWLLAIACGGLVLYVLELRLEVQDQREEIAQLEHRLKNLSRLRLH